MKIKILQVNTDRGREAVDLMYRTVYKEKVDVAVVAEPNRKQTGGSQWYRDRNGDAAIRIFNRNIEVAKSGLEHEGFVWVELKDMVIYSCYSSPNITNQEFQNYLMTLGRSLRTHSKGIIVAGDLNAKSHMWGSRNGDEKGQMLLDWMAEHSMTLHNRGNNPTFLRRGCESYLDVTLSSERIAAWIKDWKVTEEENLSFHKNIYYTVTDPDIETRPTETRWRISEARLPHFVKELRKEVNPTSEMNAHRGMAAINKAMHKTFKRKGGQRYRAVYWWNEEVAETRRESLIARRKMTRGNGDSRLTEEEKEHLRDEYTAKRAKLRKTIARAKSEAWKKTCEEVNNDVWGTGYQIVCKKLKKMPGNKIAEEQEIQIAENLFPKHEETRWPPVEVQDRDIPYFREDELLMAMRRAKNKKSPGPDQLPPEIIKLAISELPNPFLNMMNHQLREGIFPKVWKTAKLVLIEKPNKPGEQETRYRPLCLIDVMGKILEQLIATRLLEEVGPRLAENQYGFIKGKSTIDALKRVTEVIRRVKEKPFGSNRFAVLVTIDIKNAFNSVPWRGIMDVLDQFGVSKYLTRIIGSYLEDRRILVRGREIKVTSGVPQGSVLGPLLWIIYYNSVLKTPMPEGVTLIGYADDTAIVVTAKTETILTTNANIALGRLEQAIGRKQLKLETTKTEAVLLAGALGLGSITLEINGITIETGNNLKYLGVCFGRNGSMKEHVVETAKKAEKTVAALSRLMPNVGGPRAGKRRILASVAYSVILYAAPVWKSAMRYEKYQNILSRLQRRMAIRVGSAYCTISAEAIQVITGTTPIMLMIEERENMYGMEDIGRQQVRNETIRNWQRKWEEDTGKARWTKKLIRDVGRWVNRKHGEIDYHITQLLSGHGCFASYLKRFSLKETDECWYCGAIDTPQHTFFECQQWAEQRMEVNAEVGTPLTDENIVDIMLESDNNWELIQKYIKAVLKQKELDETRMKEERNRRPE